MYTSKVMYISKGTLVIITHLTQQLHYLLALEVVNSLLARCWEQEFDHQVNISIEPLWNKTRSSVTAVSHDTEEGYAGS